MLGTEKVKNKKAMNLITVFELIIAALAVLFIFIPLGNWIVGIFTDTPNKEVTNSAKAFAEELDLLSLDAQAYGKARIEFILVSQKKFGFKSYNKGAQLPPQCQMQSCFCVVDENFNPKKCYSVNENIEFSNFVSIEGTGELKRIIAEAKKEDKKTIISLSQ